MAGDLLCVQYVEVTSLCLSCSHLYFINVPLCDPNAIQPDLLDAGRSSPLPLGLMPPLQSGVLCYHSRLWMEKYIFLFRLWITLPEPPKLFCHAANSHLGIIRAEELCWAQGAAGPEVESASRMAVRVERNA